MQQNGQQGQGQAIGVANAAELGGLGHASSLTAMEGVSLGGVEPRNTPDFQRRRSVPHLFPGALAPQGGDRRMSLVDFGNPSNAVPDYQLGNMPGLGGLEGTASPYAQQGLITMPDPQVYGTLAPESTGIAAFPNLDMASMSANTGHPNLYNSPDLRSQYPPPTLNPAGPDLVMDMGLGNVVMNVPNDTRMADFGFGGSGDMMGVGHVFDGLPVPQEPPNLIPNPDLSQFQTDMPPPELRETSVPASFHSPAASTTGSQAMSHSSGGRSSIPAGTPSSTAATTGGLTARQESQKDVYSKSGFDMLRALYYVATRKNPTVEIGAVDMSCSFIVCDLTLNDCPIIYASDNFQNLTGYNRHEIVGKNCRFLQSPDGVVEAGSRREFVANDAVFKLKNALAEGREIQQSLINYRKGGKPFLNLLTLIPIPWDNDKMKYCIGFQIDLVECPDAISGQESGAMQVDYRHDDIGQYFFSPPSSTHWEPKSGQSLSVDEVSTLLEQLNPRAPASEWHKQSWDKMLLENADDVVHVLSLKGLFIYLSPACKKILEYDTTDLVGASLASVCHPSDIVPVTRELKDAQPGATVDFAFRIRRKHSGYTWFESRGTLFSEPAKARKYMILVGRKRPVFSLRRRCLDAFGGGVGVGDGEFWSKMSTSGMFLCVSSAVLPLLGLQPADLEGTSMQELLRRESRAEFGRTVEKARKGAVVGFRHELTHRRGQLVPAYTVFYPGDAPTPGQKPSFLIAQTKVAKGAARVIAGGSKLAGGTAPAAAAAAVAPAPAPSPFEDLPSGVVLGHQKQLVSPAVAAAGREEEDDDDIFVELKTTRCTSWQFELRQMEKVNRLLAEEVTQLMAGKKKRKRRRGPGLAGGGGGGGAGSGSTSNGVSPSTLLHGCAMCHTKDTPEWRRGPSGNRDLCNSCGLRFAKQQAGKVSPRTGASRASSGDDPGHPSPYHHHPASSLRAGTSSAGSNSPVEVSPLRREVSADELSAGSAGAGTGSVERASLGELSSAGGSVSGSAGGLEMGSIPEEQPPRAGGMSE
ncbi:uncharacterized protein THITE_2049533 [Thermothielavioides terrestris NRRL 8126]|uniref:Uncharacterized protein n=1 Tax=Thermothielavioides terrestris (strain ATCC 38088 / NRRL 8126) TaxID=578455 RepID=G2R6R5_THETT|nr:uncharacterized protein THITE_2049533 [Thermothielavioides terrestris NRRL 8126]AEO67697.1 hypothetical protein THITE_2049533 [Thermothielavioides terrestris NRRL 8126]